MRVDLAKLAAICLAGLAVTANSAQARSVTLYESFGPDLFSIDLRTNTQSHISVATNNLTAADGHVFWQDNRRIYQANPDLTNVTSFHFSVLPPSDFAVGPDGNTLYEAFGPDLFSIDLRTNAQNHISVPTNNLTAAGGHIYWQDNRRIYQANPDLTNVTSFHFSVLAPSDFAVSPDENTLYEAFGPDLFAIDLRTNTQYHITVPTNKLTAADGHIFWLDNRRVYEANPDLTDVTSLHFSVLPPSDFAIGDVATFTAAPEASTWLLMAIGFLGVGLWRPVRGLRTRAA